MCGDDLLDLTRITRNKIEPPSLEKLEEWRARFGFGVLSPTLKSIAAGCAV
jgi:hypothetical protein